MKRTANRTRIQRLSSLSLSKLENQVSFPTKFLLSPFCNPCPPQVSSEAELTRFLNFTTLCACQGLQQSHGNSTAWVSSLLLATPEDKAVGCFPQHSLNPRKVISTGLQLEVYLLHLTLVCYNLRTQSQSSILQRCYKTAGKPIKPSGPGIYTFKPMRPKGGKVLLFSYCSLLKLLSDDAVLIAHIQQPLNILPNSSHLPNCYSYQVPSATAGSTLDM